MSQLINRSKQRVNLSGVHLASDISHLTNQSHNYTKYIREKSTGGAIPFWMKTLSGMLSGGIAVCIGTPFDVALVRMQADSMKPLELRRNYKNVFDAIGRIFREEGPMRLYAGLAPNILRGMSMNVGMLACYDQAKSFISANVTKDENPGKPSVATNILSSAVAGFTSAFFSLPFDMLKSRLQDMKPNSKGEMPYTGLMDCSLSIFRKEGIFAFWTGFPAYYGRCAPHAMIILMTIEQITALYKKVRRAEGVCTCAFMCLSAKYPHNHEP